MKTINVLHLASFNGNIGDNANHYGFYSSLQGLKKWNFEFTELEIREFYWKKRFFDESFVELVNSYDLLVVGGGNYFELWVDHSPTGTSVMIDPDTFKKITTPVLFNALGVDPGQGADPSNIIKFKRFLDVVFADGKNMVSLRNDGSMGAMKNLIGDRYASKCLHVPDAGCMLGEFPIKDEALIKKGHIAVNLAGDMLALRYEGGNNTYKNFIESMVGGLNFLLENDYASKVIFVPHIYSDINCIYHALKAFPDSIRRTKVEVAPLLTGFDGLSNFTVYKNAKLTFAMRFHANLCSISYGRPTIALANYRQIYELYKELNATDYVFDVRGSDSNKGLIAMAAKALDEKKGGTFFNDVSQKLVGLYMNYIIRIDEFLERNVS